MNATIILLLAALLLVQPPRDATAGAAYGMRRIDVGRQLFVDDYLAIIRQSMDPSGSE